MRFLIFILYMIVCGLSVNTALGENSIILYIADQIITTKDLDNRVKDLQLYNHLQKNKEIDIQSLQQVAMQSLQMEIILFKQIGKNNIPNDMMLQQMITSIEKEFQIPKGTIFQESLRRDVNIDSLYNYIKLQSLRQDLIGQFYHSFRTSKKEIVNFVDINSREGIDIEYLELDLENNASSREDIDELIYQYKKLENISANDSNAIFHCDKKYILSFNDGRKKLLVPLHYKFVNSDLKKEIQNKLSMWQAQTESNKLLMQLQMNHFMKFNQ